jgi:3-hydroxyacyl-[acyl-carrier-protein] dehydratase
VKLEKEQIKEILPHRDPFLLIDEVIELEVGSRVVAMKYVRADEYYFQGHFPQEKVMPGC